MFTSNHEFTIVLKHKKETIQYVHSYGSMEDNVVSKVFAGVTLCSSFVGVFSKPGLNCFFCFCSFPRVSLEINMK